MSENLKKKLIRVTKTNCCVLGCKNKLENTCGNGPSPPPNLKFFLFPENNDDQRKGWIQAIKDAAEELEEGDLEKNNHYHHLPKGAKENLLKELESKEENNMICSAHFHNHEIGPDKSHINYLPTHFPGINNDDSIHDSIHHEANDDKNIKIECDPLDDSSLLAPPPPPPPSCSTSSRRSILRPLTRKILNKKLPGKLTPKPFENPKICQVVGCYNNTSNKEIKFYFFPSNDEQKPNQRALWIKLLDRSGVYSSNNSYNDKLVCEKHFYNSKGISNDPHSPMYAPIYFPHNKRIHHDITSKMKEQEEHIQNKNFPIPKIEEIMDQLSLENKNLINRSNLFATIQAQDWQLMMKAYINECQAKDMFTDITITNGVTHFRAHKMLLSSTCMLKKMIDTKNPVKREILKIFKIIYDSLMFASNETDVILIDSITDQDLKYLKGKIYQDLIDCPVTLQQEDEEKNKNSTREIHQNIVIQEPKSVLIVSEKESRCLENINSTGQFFNKFNHIQSKIDNQTKNDIQENANKVQNKIEPPSKNTPNSSNIILVPTSSSLPPTAVPCSGPPPFLKLRKNNIPIANSSIDKSTTDAIIQKVSKMRAIEPTKLQVPLKPGSDKKVTIIVQTVKTNPDEFKKKNKRKIEELNTKCDGCKSTFNSLVELEEHVLRYVYDPNPFEFNCMLCDEAFNSKEEKLKHYKSNHKNRVDPWKCFECDVRCSSLPKVYTHRVKKHTESSYLCSLCSKSFKTLNALEKHEALHETDASVCKFCGKKFLTAAGLKDHENDHNNIKTHVCDRCGKAFSSHRAINCHVRIVHNAQPPCKRPRKNRVTNNDNYQ